MTRNREGNPGKNERSLIWKVDLARGRRQQIQYPDAQRPFVIQGSKIGVGREWVGGGGGEGHPLFSHPFDLSPIHPHKWLVIPYVRCAYVPLPELKLWPRLMFLFFFFWSMKYYSTFLMYVVSYLCGKRFYLLRVRFYYIREAFMYS